MAGAYTADEWERNRRSGNVIAHAAPGEGVVFTDWLEGPRGAGFALFREARHSDEQIAAAKRWLRANRDVVRIEVRELQSPRQQEDAALRVRLQQELPPPSDRLAWDALDKAVAEHLESADRAVPLSLNSAADSAHAVERARGG